jgi:hypothetical protein
VDGRSVNGGTGKMIAVAKGQRTPAGDPVP